MELLSDWTRIRAHFNQSFRSNYHVSIASVSPENEPTVTPIGSLFLNDDRTGFYFEKFPSKLPEHVKGNPNICILAVNSGTLFWLSSLFKGRFSNYPALKLYGKLGVKRKATDQELKRLHKRMRSTNGLKGNRYLWSDMEYVRVITFTKAEKVDLGKMTKDL